MNRSRELIFWLGTATFMVVLFGNSYSSYTDAFYFVAFLLPIITATSYWFSLVLVPQYLLQKRYFLFVLYSVYTLIISVYFEMIIIVISFVLLANYRYESMLPAARDIAGLTITMYLIVMVKTLFVLIAQLSQKNDRIRLLERGKEYEKGILEVRSERKTRRVAFADILIIESLSDYVRIVRNEAKPVVAKEKIGRLEEILPTDFVRIHRSYIVNRHKVDNYNNTSVLINELEVPISRKYKQSALESLQAQR